MDSSLGSVLPNTSIFVPQKSPKRNFAPPDKILLHFPQSEGRSFIPSHALFR